MLVRGIATRLALGFEIRPFFVTIAAMASRSRRSSFSPTMRVDYGTRKPRTPRNSSGTPLEPPQNSTGSPFFRPPSWKQVKWDGCTFYLPPGFNDVAGSARQGGLIAVTCPPMKKYGNDTSGVGGGQAQYPQLNSKLIAPPTLLALGSNGSKGAALRGYLPDPAPAGWFLFSSDSVGRGGTITVESNLAWNTSRPIQVFTQSRVLGASFISPQKIRLRIPSSWPTNFLVSTAGNNAALVFKGTGADSGGSESNIVAPTTFRQSLIRVTAPTALSSGAGSTGRSRRSRR